MTECKLRNLNCSISYKRVNGYSVEIYTAYGFECQAVFYTDGHIKPKKAIKKALLFLNV